MSTHVLPNVSASIAPGPAALAPYHPPREAVIDPVYTPRVDSVHTCVTLEANEKPQRGWHHLRRDTRRSRLPMYGQLSHRYPSTSTHPAGRSPPVCGAATA